MSTFVLVVNCIASIRGQNVLLGGTNQFMESLEIHCYLMQPPGPEKCNLYYSAELKEVGLFGKNTPLILATKTGNTGIVMEILKHGPDINYRDSSGRSALSYALQFVYLH